MSGGIISAIVRKDVAAFRADRFFMLMTLLGIILYPVFFWLLPSSVDETIRLGVTPPAIQQALEGLQGSDGAQGAEGSEGAEGSDGLESTTQGLEFVPYPDETSLATAVEQGEDGVVAGMAFPADFAEAAAAGRETTVTLYVTADLPPEVEAMLTGLVSEIGYLAAGQPPPVDPMTATTVLGEDRVGNQVTLREQLRPLIAFFVLIVETFALASLVANEVQQRTVQAVLVTPASSRDFIAAKGVTGTSLAFAEAVLIMLLIGGFAVGAPILLVALLLGAVLVTGFGLLSGAFGKDFITVLFISMLFMIPLMVPAFAALFPGTPAGWIRALPSYGLVDTIVAVTTQSAGWAEVAPSLLALAAWCLVIFAAGAAVLSWRVARL
jgi:ABC-2 type transport system permease protein